MAITMRIADRSFVFADKAPQGPLLSAQHSVCAYETHTNLESPVAQNLQWF
jgi:hypothetical protein